MKSLCPTLSKSDSTNHGFAYSKLAGHLGLNASNLWRVLNLRNLFRCQFMGVIAFALTQSPYQQHCSASVFRSEASFHLAVNHIVASCSPENMRWSNAKLVVANMAGLKPFSSLSFCFFQKKMVGRNIPFSIPKLTISRTGFGPNPGPASLCLLNLCHKSLNDINGVKFSLFAFRCQQD